MFRYLFCKSVKYTLLGATEREAMMTDISSTENVKANAAANAASANAKTSTVSDSTKRTLEAMGITVTAGMTEAQAQAKIAEAQARKDTNNGENQQSESEAEIMADAKTLASAVGVTVSNSDDLSEVLDNIGEKLEQMIDESQNNPGVLSMLTSYYEELASLDEQYDELTSIQSGIFGAMEQTATSNKLALGLE